MTQDPYRPQPPTSGVYSSGYAAAGAPPAPRSGGTSPDPADPPPRRTGALRLGVPTMVLGAAAVLALLLSLVSTVVAWRAASRAGQAVDRVNALGVAPTGGTGPATGPTAAVPPTDASTDGATDGSTQAPSLNAQTQYKVKYTDEALKIPSGGCANAYIDLDEPRVRFDVADSEITYRGACTDPAPIMTLGEGVEGSEVQSEAVTPAECAEQIRTSPLSRENHPLRRGQVYCIETSLDAARNSAITWKMVVLSVTAIAEDGTVALKASAWDIPS